MVAATYVAIGLLFGLIILPFALLAGLAGSRDGNGAVAGAGLLAGLFFYAVIIVFYAVVGWILGAILAAVYNFVAGRIGGLRFDVSIEGPGGYPGYPVGYPSRGYPGTGKPYPAGYVAPTPGPGWSRGPPQPPA